MSEQATTQPVSATERADRKVRPSNGIVALIEGKYWAYLLLIPSLLLVAAVVVYPVISGVLAQLPRIPVEPAGAGHSLDRPRALPRDARPTDDPGRAEEHR